MKRKRNQTQRKKTYNRTLENIAKLNRKEVWLRGLRIWHSGYTHFYLINKEEQTKYATFRVHLTMKYIFVECRQTAEAARTKYNILEFLYQSLGLNESTIPQTQNFIKEIKIEHLLLTITIQQNIALILNKNN